MNVLLNTPQSHFASGVLPNELLRRRLVNLVFLVLWLLVLEGALRKWIFPQLQTVLFFVRIPITFLLYALAFKYHRWPQTNTPLLIFYLFAVVGVFLAAFQLIIGGYDYRYLLIVGYGWVNYFYYAPLAFLIGEQFCHQDLWRLMRHMLLFSVASAAIVILQFYSPLNSPINLGSGLDESSQFAGLGAALGFVRPTGFFTSPLGQEQFVSSIIAITMAIFLRSSNTWQINPLLAWFGLASLVIMIFFSQSRGLFFMLAFMIFTGLIGGMLTGRLRIVINLSLWPMIVGGVALAIWMWFFSDSFDVFQSRWTEAWDSESLYFSYGIFSRLFYEASSFLYYLEDTPLIGYLLGISGNAALILDWVQLPDAAMEWIRYGYGAWAEQGLAKNIVELGPLLGLAFISFRVWLIIWLGSISVRAARHSGDILPLMLFAYVAILLLYRQITAHGTVNGFTWMFFGFCLAAGRNAIHDAK